MSVIPRCVRAYRAMAVDTHDVKHAIQKTPIVLCWAPPPANRLSVSEVVVGYF
jgi:hypothetical protein